MVLATGVVDRKPGIDQFHHDGHGVLAPYLRGHEVGYCVLCEGWRMEGRRVAVVGDSPQAAQVAEDVAGHFKARVTRLAEDDLAALRDEKGRIVVTLRDGREETFDQAIFHMGWYKVNNELAVSLGAAVDHEGCVRTTEDCEAIDPDGNIIAGLFAVGDLRAGAWKQVVIGWGDAERAVIKAYVARLPGR
jgi:thioredoxin reductase